MHVPKIILLLVIFYTDVAPYGEKIDTLPIWQERAVLVLVNSCRVAPVPYRNRFLKTGSILLPQTYPAVTPLYWSRELNAASRYHSVEMARSCGLQHDCNGKTYDARIRTFYAGGNYLGENIAGGYQAPQQAVNGWLLDEYPPGDTALDGSGTDGHRKNIMSKNYTVTGCGYFVATSGKSSTPYWCQDFGSGQNEFSYHPVPSASHLFLEKGVITFLLDFYHTAATDVRVFLVLDRMTHTMPLTMGTTERGVYELSFPVSSVCRTYYFIACYNGGDSIRYPEIGSLLTTGEGTCTQDFIDETMVVPSLSERRANQPEIYFAAGRLRYIHPAGTATIIQSIVFDSRGRKIGLLPWNNGSSDFVPSGMHGFVIMAHLFTNGITRAYPMVIPEHDAAIRGK